MYIIEPSAEERKAYNISELDLFVQDKWISDCEKNGWEFQVNEFGQCAKLADSWIVWWPVSGGNLVRLEAMVLSKGGCRPIPAVNISKVMCMLYKMEELKASIAELSE
jgi:hypothetical protein